MRTLSTFGVAAATLLLSLPSASLDAQRSSSRFDGAWRIVRFEVASPDSTYLAPPREGIAVISGRHFSQIWVLANRPGVQQASQLTTAEQKAARFDVLIANAGTFEVRDTTVTFTYTQAKNPGLVGTSIVRRYRIRGDTLWFMGTAPWQRDSTKTVRTTVTYVRQQ